VSPTGLAGEGVHAKLGRIHPFQLTCLRVNVMKPSPLMLVVLRKALAVMLGAGGLLAPAAHAADDYPNKPVSIIVAYAPGGQGDVFARLVGEKLSTVVKQPVVVDNRPGVSGTVGTRLATQAKKDGYTLFLGQTGEITVNRVIMKDLGYDPLKELTPVVMIGNAPLVMLAANDAPYNTVAEFIQAARARPGEFSYGSVGAGTPGHLSAVALGLGAKLQMTHVPYKGVGPLMADLMAGRLQAFFSSASAAMPQIKGGKLKALAVTTPQRMNSLPQVPTVAESGLPGFSYTLWGGLFAPAGTPQSVIDSLNKEVNAILTSPELRARLENDNVAVPRNSPAEFADYVKSEAGKYEKLVRDANLKLD
jgi:tripartite-type tricarboxylate transporter receptor subunit TctC